MVNDDPREDFQPFLSLLFLRFPPATSNRSTENRHEVTKNVISEATRERSQRLANKTPRELRLRSAFSI